MAKRSKINNRDAKYELLRQSEHRDDSGQISNKATSQLYLDNYYEKNDDDSYSLNSATQRSIQASHDRTQRAANAQARKATYNTKSVNSVSRNLVDDVGKRYGYTRPTPTQQTSTSQNIRNDALQELKNRRATSSNATPSTAPRTGNTQNTVSQSLVDYVSKHGNNTVAQATRHHAAMTDFANKGINRAIVNAVKAPVNALKNAGGNPLKMADEEAEKYGKNRAAIPEKIRQYSEMTSGQKYMYNHLFDTQGRDAAEEYRSRLMDDVNRRVARQNTEGNLADKTAVGRVANQFVSGVTNSGEGLQKLAQWVTLDKEKRAQSVNDYETEMRREKAGKVEGVLQDIASSTGNMVGSAALGSALGGAAGVSEKAVSSLSGALFGASQGGHAYQEAINEGYSPIRSALYAGEEAASEYYTEKLLGGVEALGGGRIAKALGNTQVAKAAAEGINKAVKSDIGRGLLNRLGSHAANALGEASQEGLQYWTQGIARNVILGEGKDESGNIDPVKGLSFSDPEFWYSAALGAANSMLMNVGGDVLHLAGNEIEHRTDDWQQRRNDERNYQSQFQNDRFVNDNTLFNDMRDYTEFSEAPSQNLDTQAPASEAPAFRDVEMPGDISSDNNITVTTEGSDSNTKDVTNAAVDKLKKTRTRKSSTSSVDDVKNTSDAVSDTVNAAVDALKNKAEQNTAESTPDAAKEATQAAVEAINTEDAAQTTPTTEEHSESVEETVDERNDDAKGETLDSSSISAAPNSEAPVAPSAPDLKSALAHDNHYISPDGMNYTIIRTIHGGFVGGMNSIDGREIADGKTGIATSEFGSRLEAINALSELAQANRATSDAAVQEEAPSASNDSARNIIKSAFEDGGVINQNAVNKLTPNQMQMINDMFEGNGDKYSAKPDVKAPERNYTGALTGDQLRAGIKAYDNFTANKVEYNVVSEDDGYVGTLRDTSNDLYGGFIVDGRALRYSTEPKETMDAAIDELVQFAENNGLLSGNGKKSADNYTPYVDKVSTNVTAPRNAEPSEKPWGAFQATNEAKRRAGVRFKDDDAARTQYVNSFSEYMLGRFDEDNDVSMQQVVTDYDENMAKAYQAGFDGKPISFLQDDAEFKKFDSVMSDATDAMWKLGYNQHNIRTQKQEKEEKRAEKPRAGAAPAKEAPKAEPKKMPTVSSNPQSSIADRVAEKVASGQSFTANWLFDVANNAYGGTMAEGTYSVKDAYDGMELGINKYLMNADFVKAGNGSLKDALNTLAELQKIMRNIPTQTKRTEEMESYQQFSTPPTIAFTAARLANITSDDVVLEPSAGIGGLALWGKAWGAKVYGNELSKRRLAFLNELGLDGTFNENAEQINNVLPDNIQPTVVIMNPPFSSTAGRMKSNKTANAKRHIEQALDRLEDGGRLVAILGRGMADDAPAFSAWWNDLRKEYTIRSNVRIDGSNYQKYGTTFDDQLVVIDKVGPQEGKTLTGEYKDLSKLLTDLEGVRNERNPISRSDMESNKSVSGTEPGRSGVVSERTERSRPSTHDGSRNDATDRRGISGSSEEGLGESGGRRSGRNGSERDSRKPGKSEDGRVGIGRDTERRVSKSSGESNESDSGRVDQPVKLEKPASSEKAERVATVDINSTFTPYEPEKVRIKGAKAHPGKLVESAAMGAVEPPDATYVPHLPQELIDRGMPSSAQLENIVYAGQAHQQFLPSGERKGYFIGDGTGVGKGLQLASIILDNFNQGRRKAVWVSEKESLIKDAQRDWADLEQDKKDVFSFKKFKNNDIKASEGICFATYDTLGSRKQDGIDRLTNWLGKDFDGVIVLDEAHNMKNAVRIKKARGSSGPTQKAIWGLKLQESFPKARIVYATATGASSIENFAYLERLGLWGPGTSFTDFKDFYTKVSAGGLAAMELVARDMKSLGDYMARSISYDGVQYDTIEHELTPIQHEIYDKMSDAWRVVLRNIDKALELTGAANNGNARGAAASAFWGSLQRFYNQILTSMAMPSVLSDIQTQLDNGKSVVIQLTNTNEAEAKRKIADNAKNGGDLDDLDLTPSETLIDFLQKSFPVQLYEEYQDENGNTHSKPVTNSNGEPVLDKKAIALRDKLIGEVGQMQVPDGPLEMLLDTFGVDNVAEVTGRTRRVVYHRQSDGSMKRVVEKWSKKKGEADTAAFQSGKKRILIFSEAGGTGKSYHADLRAKNQQQRVHYILQAGWKADAAIQGLGRTHRTNEASTPIYKLVTTNVMGQKRFTSTIAKRLNQMGALTKGQRDAGSGVFSERDNLENPISEDALAKYYETAPDEVIRELGIKIYDKNGLINKSATDLRNVPKFLNRILALRVEDQNEVFENFYSILEEMTENAMKDGTLDRGMESYKADKIEVADEKPVYQDENTHAETKYVQLKVYNRPALIPYENVEDAHLNFMGMYRLKDGSVRAVYKGSTITDKRTGEVVQKYRLDGPVRGKSSYFIEKTFNEQAEKLPKKEWKKAWEAETQKAPEYVENTLHMLTGTLLPIWSKLPENNTRVMRIVTTDGKQYLGRVISPDQIDSVLRNLGTTRTKKQYTLKSLMSEVLDKNQELVLRDNRWKIRRRRVSGDWRIEVTGSNLWALNRVEGIISETIGYEKRYFIPTGSKGEYTLGSIIRSNPVMDVRSAGTDDDDGVLHSLSKHDDTSDTSDSAALNSKKNPTPSEDGEKPEDRWTAKKNSESMETSSKRLSDIIGQAAHDWGFNVTSGTRYVKGEGNMGEFNERNRGIRTKITNDLPTFSHEFGHWLDKTYNITDSVRLPKEVRKDIETAFFMNPDNADLYSGKSASVKLKEGLAEFVRYYLQNRDAARIDFPKLTDYILKQMSPGELAKFNGFADQVNAYYSMDAGDAKSSIRLKEDSRPDYRTNMEKFHDWYHSWYQENVDSVHGFREFDVRNGTNTYTYASNAAYTDARVAQTIMEGIYDLDGNYIGPGLKDALAGIDVNDKEVYIAFGEYLAVKHGIEWIAQNKRVFADDRKNNAQWMENRIAEIEAEHPEFIEAADRLYKFESDFMWTYAVGEGLISADAYKAMQKENPCYVPFFRAGFKERGNSLFKAKGSGRDLIHPVDNIIDNITKLQNAAARNAVMLQLRREAVRSKADALFMEKMPDPKVPVEVDLRGIKERLYNETHDIAGIEIAPEMQDALQEVIGSIDDTMTQFQLGKAKPNRGEIKILVAGKPEFWKINDPLLLSSITSMDYRNASKVITAFGSVSRFITSNITGNNVIWSVFSNAPRDLQTLLTYSMATKNPGKMLQGVADTYLNYINNARGKSVDPLFSEYLAMGGEGAPVWSGSKDYVKDMRKLISSTREHPEMNPLKWAMFVSDMIEMGPRFATYKMCREAGMNPQKAFYAAMDITVNFRRNGINSKTLNQFIPFFNAGVQATDKMIRYFTAEDLREMKLVGGAGDGGDGGDGTGKWVEVNGKERGRAIAGRIAFSAALSLIMAALVVAWSRRNKESKDDFDMLSNYTKNSYFCISLGDGKYFTIPKGQNVAVLESFFERLLERTVGGNDHAFDEYYSYLADNVLPSIASDLVASLGNVKQDGLQDGLLDLASGTLGSLGVIGEMAQLVANQDYLGKPIVSSQNKDKVYEKQYTEKSSEMAYLLGKYLHLSPQIVDHFGKNILGWMWTYPSALFPINDGKGVKGERDWTLGVKNTYNRDNVYSNDLSNWIYDKAEDSKKMYKSYGTNEQALESTLDSNMKSYYQNAVGLAKNEENGREIRRAALDKLKEYRKESEHGVEDADRKAIYDIVESNGNTSILPGVMGTSIKSNGETYDLTGKEYMEYQDAYEDRYYDYADDCIKATDDEEQQSKIAGDLKQLAREQAMDEILSKKGIKSSSTSKLKDWADSGYDVEDYFTLKQEMNDAKAGKDSTKARKNAVKSVINSSGLSSDAKEKLWAIADYNSK